MENGKYNGVSYICVWYSEIERENAYEERREGGGEEEQNMILREGFFLGVPQRLVMTGS